MDVNYMTGGDVFAVTRWKTGKEFFAAGMSGGSCFYVLDEKTVDFIS